MHVAPILSDNSLKRRKEKKCDVNWPLTTISVLICTQLKLDHLQKLTADADLNEQT